MSLKEANVRIHFNNKKTRNKLCWLYFTYIIYDSIQHTGDVSLESCLQSVVKFPKLTYISGVEVRSFALSISTSNFVNGVDHNTWDTLFNPLNAELNSISYLLTLLGPHNFLHVSRIRVKSLTLRLLMSYIYIYIWSTNS